MATTGVAVAVVIAYLGSYAVVPKDGFWINDNECKYLEVEGMIRTGYRDFSIPWPGKELDPEFSCNPLIDPFGHVADGKLYCFYPPMFSLLSSLPYRLLGMQGLHIGPFLAALLTLPAVWYLAALIGAPWIARPIAVLICGLATPVWFYSLTFWEHTPTVCLTTWSAAFCMRSILRGGLGPALLGGVFCGLAITMRDDLYLFGAAIALALLLYVPRRRWTAAALFVLALVVAVAPLWWFQWKALGHPLGHHFTHHSPLEFGIGRFLVDRFAVVATLLLDCHGRGVVSFAIALPYLALWFIHPRLPHEVYQWFVPLISAVGLGTGCLIAAGHLTSYSPMWWLLTANSLFAVSPVLIVAFVRRRGMSDETDGADAPVDVSRVIWLIVLIYVLSFVLLVPKLNAAGIHWGCRLVLPAYPLLAIMAACTIARWWQDPAGRRVASKVVLIATVAGSVGLQIYSVRLLSARKSFSARLNRVVGKRPEAAIVTYHGYIPQYLSGCFYDKMIFLPSGRRSWLNVCAALRRHGIHDVLFVAAWRPGRGRPIQQDGVIDDGMLKYIAIALKPIDLRRPESMQLALPREPATPGAARGFGGRSK